MFNASAETTRTVSALTDFFNSTKTKGIVLGVSGGLDSAVCLKLLTKSIAPQKITALLMPEKNENLNELISFVDSTGAKHIVLELNPLLCELNVPWNQSILAEMNLKARARMLLLYNYANSNNYLVCGTGNKSELTLGYFTKFGDGAADFLPIGSYWKTEVYEIAEELSVPQKIINKIPSADLIPNQSDEKELGAKYEVIDKILIELENKKSIQEIALLGFKKELIESLKERIEKNKHKLKPIKII